VTFCGLDFGTSNSAIGTYQNGQVQLCPLENSQLTMPTALFYHTSGRCTFGREAISDYLDGEPGRLMRSIKSLLGTSLMEESTAVKGVNYPFKSVLTDYIAMLKFHAETWLGESIDCIAHGRPVRFVERDGDQNQQAEDTLRDILLDVGFEKIVFQYEPLAAAQCFAKETGGHGIAFIVDMGGGTTDFTVIDLDKATSTGELPANSILANHGIRLGGTNFDKSISLAKVMPMLGYETGLRGGKGLQVPNWLYHMLSDWSEINFLYARNLRHDVDWVIQNGSDEKRMSRLSNVIERHLGHNICHDIEAAKMMLSENDQQLIDLDYVEKESQIAIDADEVSRILGDQFIVFKKAMLDTLRLCDVQESDVATLCLTGGSTNLLAVKRSIQETFPHANMIEQDKFSAVCRGLVLEGANNFR
jgi:hypothetical chaperone protein